MAWQDDLVAELEKLGESEVCSRWMKGEYGDNGEHGSVDSPKSLVVRNWLRAKEDNRNSGADSRKESREEKSLSISREALSNSRRATIIAIIATIIAASDKVIAFLRWLGVLKP